MSIIPSPPLSQLDDLLESLWNLEDIHRSLVQEIQQLVVYLESQQEKIPSA